VLTNEYILTKNLVLDLIKNLYWFTFLIMPFKIAFIISFFPSVKGKIYWRIDIYWRYVKKISAAIEIWLISSG
jgi:hypothetical protein